MNAEPISKELFEKLTKAGVTTMKLRFSGGSDEGYLDVDLGDIDHFDEEEGSLSMKLRSGLGILIHILVLVRDMTMVMTLSMIWLRRRFI